MDNYKQIKLSTKIKFKCEKCGKCCRSIEDSVMVTSYDLYRMASLIGGEPDFAIDTIMEKYLHVVLLPDSNFPCLVLNTTGEDNHCIFLSDNNECKIHEAKPKVCEIYPFQMNIEDNLDKFEYFICFDKQHHFKHNEEVLANDWFHTRVTKEYREFFKLMYEYNLEIASKLLKIQGSAKDRALELILLYQYSIYDINSPFFFFYKSNHLKLMRILRQLE